MPYQPGTMRRTGAPCSGGIGSSFIRRASNVSGSIALETGRDRANGITSAISARLRRAAPIRRISIASHRSRADSRTARKGTPVHRTVPTAPSPHASPAGSGRSPARPLPAHSSVTGKVRVSIASRSSILSVSDRSTAPLICSVCLPRARSGRAKWLLTKNWDSGVVESDRFSSDVSTLSGSAERIFTPASLARRASRVFCLARARSRLTWRPATRNGTTRILPRNFRTESRGVAEISWKRWRRPRIGGCDLEQESSSAEHHSPRAIMTDGPRAASPDVTVPGPPLPSSVTERFVEAGGVRFRYLQGGTISGLPVVLLHVWPTWAEVWLPVAWVLGARHPWIAPDLPCQGHSSPLPGNARTLTAYRNAIASFVDALDLPRFAVVGNSMGGTLAIMVALDRPARVAKVVVLDAAGLTPKLPGRTARMYLPFLLPSFVRAPGPKSVRKLLTKAVFHDPSFADDPWVNAIVAAWRPWDRCNVFIATGLALRRRDASVSADLARVRAPTLVLSGRHDVQFPWQAAEAASRRIPESRFAAIEDAGHFPMVERPRETAQLISEFLGAKR